MTKETEVILVCNWLDFFIRRFWKRNHFGFFKLRRKNVFFSMHKLKTYVSESIMYANANFSSWLLIPSRLDDFLFSSLDMYLPSSETERYGITNGSCPLVFARRKGIRNADQALSFRGEHADRIVDPPSW